MAPNFGADDGGVERADNNPSRQAISTEGYLDQLLAICIVMLSRITDPTHLSVAEVARIKRVCEKTVRNWIAKRKLTLEIISGTRQSGIPTEQVFSGWIDIQTATEILKKRGR